MNLNDPSPIKGKTWGRCSKTEMLKIIEQMNYEYNYLNYLFSRYRLKTAWMPDDV